TLAGFGQWVSKEFKNPDHAIKIIPRDDFNHKEVADEIKNAIKNYCQLTKNEREQSRNAAFEISRIALWKNLIRHYWEAYEFALVKASGKEVLYLEKERVEKLPETQQVLIDIQPVWRRVLVQQSIPEKLKPLEELSKNLWWSWNQDAIKLFESINNELWKEVGENPIVLLDRLPYDMIRKLEKDKAFIANLTAVYTEFQEYMNQKPREDSPSVAYFTMEYGLHNSLKIYSGGLGLLAGDYLKEASDYNYNMIGVGLLYRFGYFRQIITAGGDQVAQCDAQDFSKLPVIPVRDQSGQWISVQLMFPGRTVHARIWKVQVGRIPLYLLDTDYEANNEADRTITDNLYGGDNENRFKQELLLGIGGIRTLREIGVKIDVYHCNEGHAAFTGIERLREYIQNENLTFPEAQEIVRASSLFTTHTPVPAGHDYFEEDLMRAYIAHYPSRLKIEWNQLMNLGRFNPSNVNEKFSMSVLAVNLSQEVNGVSRLHGQVSKEMFTQLWKGYMTSELHIGYVTNGVHLPTWLSRSWKDLYSKTFGEDFLKRQEDRVMWDKIIQVPAEDIW
ncbi:MAG TPA: alpha-glucan family phosphorylase, partial [Bacteroidaceae bacterium]|nr:alpha-glucan family phosphorylase [Bacteroidaceae bacterium]